MRKIKFFKLLAFDYYIQKLEKEGFIQIYNDNPYSVWIATKDSSYIKQLDNLCKQGGAKDITLF